MRPDPVLLPARLGVALLPAAMDVPLARRGGRAFALRGPRSDLTVALPEVGGALQVLVPRGFGHPLIASRVSGEFRADPTGEPCAPARWVAAGGIAAWAREVPPPAGPTRAIAPLSARSADGPWICVRPAATAWAALRLREPAAGRGPVVVAARWVLGASAEARARGVCRGMSVALARRLCPGLVVRPPVAGIDLVSEVAQRMGEWFGESLKTRGCILARLPAQGALAPGALGQAQHVARLIWQELGVEVRVAIAATPDAAKRLARWLEPGWVAVAPVKATEAWAARPAARARMLTGVHRSGWCGTPTPDLEGAVARAQALAANLSLAPSGSLRLVLDGEKHTAARVLVIPAGCGRSGRAELVGAAVRREGMLVGNIHTIRVSVVGGRPAAPEPVPVRSERLSASPAPQDGPRQLALLPGRALLRGRA